jgi:hypothetical protein
MGALARVYFAHEPHRPPNHDLHGIHSNCSIVAALHGSFLMADKPIALKPTSTEEAPGLVILNMADDAGKEYQLRMPTLDCQSVIGMLNLSLAEAVKHPPSALQGALPFARMQLAEIGEKLFVRIFVSPQLYHEYELPLNTTLAQDLITVSETRNLSKVSHPGSDRPQ